MPASRCVSPIPLHRPQQMCFLIRNLIRANPAPLSPIREKKFPSSSSFICSHLNPFSSANFAMERPESPESPRKRQKTDNVDLQENALLAMTDGAADAPVPRRAVPEDEQKLKELAVGITEFVSADNQGFAGILKKR